MISLFLSRKMASPTYHKLKTNNLTAYMFFTAISLSFIIRTQPLNISLHNNEYAAQDFGQMYHNLPKAVVYPQSAYEISNYIKRILDLGNSSGLTVAARGNGYSTYGEAQAYSGAVIDMKSLRGQEMYFHTGKNPYVDVSAGELWIKVLNESLRHGLAPKSWTNYLYVTVGGTLSNGGIGGQSFRHGPQIDNVLQLEVVTGKGEIFNCSTKENSELFYGVLGGLGQFGIITRARISLEPAPQRVKLIEVLYVDFLKFKKDLEHLISYQDTFDYIEGFIKISGRHSEPPSAPPSMTPSSPPSVPPSTSPSAPPSSLKDPLQTSMYNWDRGTSFIIQVALYYNSTNETQAIQKVSNLLQRMSTIPILTNTSDVSYFEFLNRVHTLELKLKKLTLWKIPHPWLNLLVPKNSIRKFVQVVFRDIVNHNVNGPILIYPVNKSTWSNETSLVTPEEQIFYLVSIQSAAKPSPRAKEELKRHLIRNRRILQFCEDAKLGVKEYLPHYATQGAWEAHFGKKWDSFVLRKSTYDPLAILTPGQKIFQKGIPIS